MSVWPKNIGGQTFQLSDFAPFNYIVGVPRLVEAMVAEAGAAQAAAATATEKLAYLEALAAGLTGGLPDLGGWTFGATGAKSISQPVTPGQFYFRQLTSPAAFRAQGVGQITGFMCSAFQTPVQFVLHRANGLPSSGAELPLGNNTDLMVMDCRGTINLSDAQASGFQMRVTTKEDVATTGTIGSRLQIRVAPLGGTASSNTLVVDHDEGLSFKGVAFVNGAGDLAIARNWISNPGFDFWPDAQSVALLSSTRARFAVRWQAIRAGAADATISRAAGFNGAQYCCRCQRNVGTSSGNSVALWQQIPTEVVRRLAGKTVRLSFDVRGGADFSGSSLTGVWYSGTAGGQIATLSGTGIGFATGAAASANINIGTIIGSAQRFSMTYAVPADALDLAFRLFANLAGTAGAADYWEVANVRLGTNASNAFQEVDLTAVRDDLLRYYRKSFASETLPAQDVGSGAGELRFPAITAGATAQRSGSLRFGAPMRSAPTVTLFNPSAANAQARDLTAGADCASTSAVNVSEHGFDVSCTGAAGTAAGNDIGVHWVADARF
jgi:hypothetical protein